MKKLVLGSTSPFRKEILEKLNIPFVCAKPNIDESAFHNESPVELVERLAIEKAKAVAGEFPDALIIGSDQVAMCDGEILGKPHNFENAVKQLEKFSNKTVVFYTGLCVYDSGLDYTTALIEPFLVHFNQLSLSDIENYLHAEQPYNCAGSFKSEGLGICLFKKLEGDDPNTLIGLPLIKLVELLKQHDVNVLAEQVSV
ncbi:septum formation inhibitor Maf [Colwellia sp. MB02u-18]|uniref:Maf family protein n=1 Tax=unclassified Colwellia TaxID=196834 RepID=UPI0015F68D4F|nr:MULTISPECIES: nucleoside triphosphate pyrophosphatase [unclassified Colwellia]MBA6224989.1 septum formation inhibitor Maf [Colwellia sp. MB3u-45]MBA6268723.1 septum formation inhibitor Maf [Colwellia sp. MB3u-43]MBA6321154.1 septum formation inhibitor Maf [Colwellia sp. MB02u-19]MBA6325707.1 septum formation inhibitor Maf [Colwellia sp. MB02u-18]MBA6332182.1 septum formation inhibitor Maf [Colwellia sp. MB02u-12]